MSNCVQVVSFSEAKAAIQTIRHQVFQQEQNVEPDLDFDGLDDIVPHLIAYYQNEPVGTARIRSLELHKVKLERMAVLSAYRGQGIGKALVQAAIAFAKAQNISEIHLNAQVHAKEFYRKLGFEPYGEEFDEAGITHVAMKKVN
ncbi:MAG: GNAT family N-acetyltransferase [Drouetiella hepatica Uher 2000/2452]|uniref:GNAT family N-acetyltransferase n=1 Tax=Drouetiella hepatica Uher 2000/2452 TaxID=904376 RepID=A0A951QBE5_9CYAN|nr:GNAT family N-acetyltransferase [Drouetiella hepatica Uher 2000/2452]